MSNEIIFKPGKFKLAVQIALILFQIIFYSLLFSACKARLIECVETANNISSKPNINWWCEDNDIIIKVSEIDYNLQYYAEITLISGRMYKVKHLY